MDGIKRHLSDILALFQEHPASVGETYWEHAGKSLTLGAKTFVASLVFTIHAIFPMFLTSTGTSMMIDLYYESLKRQNSLTEVEMHVLGGALENSQSETNF